MSRLSGLVRCDCRNHAQLCSNVSSERWRTPEHLSRSFAAVQRVVTGCPRWIRSWAGLTRTMMGILFDIRILTLGVVLLAFLWLQAASPESDLVMGYHRTMDSTRARKGPLRQEARVGRVPIVQGARLCRDSTILHGQVQGAGSVQRVHERRISGNRRSALTRSRTNNSVTFTATDLPTLEGQRGDCGCQAASSEAGGPTRF
jgi:hypothetical protein